LSASGSSLGWRQRGTCDCACSSQRASRCLFSAAVWSISCRRYFPS